MFVLTRISDVIPVAPNLFEEDYQKVLIEEIDRKYANKVIADVGLCISIYDFVNIGDAFVHPSDGTSHSQVEFRMVVFRPFVGEVLKGRIVSCNEEHIRGKSASVSLDIIIPSYAMQTPSYFDTAERLWVWKYSEGQEKFYMDLHEEIRFRVTNINFTKVMKTANGIQATTTEASDKTEGAPNAGDMRQSLARGRSASVDLSDSDPTPSAIHILVLNQKRARSASSYLLQEQHRVEQEQQSQDKHAPSRDLAQFRVGRGVNTPPPTDADVLVAAVRELPFDVVGSRSSSRTNNQSPLPETEGEDAQETQIERNAVLRRERHMAALRAFTDDVKAVSEDIEAAIIQAADELKDALRRVDEQLRRLDDAAHDATALLYADHDGVLQLWRETEVCCESRTQLITAFRDRLERIEQTRVDRVSRGLRSLTKTLMDTAHALPNEVERIIEAEAFELNVVVITNRKAYADLLARIASADVDVFLRARLQWEDGQTLWRRLRHDDAIARFCHTLESTQFRDPRERQLVLAQIRAFHRELHDERRLPILKRLQDLEANVTSAAVTSSLQELSELQRLEEERNAFFFDELRVVHDAKVREALALREALRLELHGFGALAPGGDIAACKREIDRVLQDEALDEFFRMAGGLRNELDGLSKRLQLADLIYQDRLAPVRASLDLLLSALPLESVMESMGKGAERKALQATLERMRKAGKSDLLTYLPVLQAQMNVLLGLAGLDDVFVDEVHALSRQLSHLLPSEAEAAPDERPGSSAAGATLSTDVSRSPATASSGEIPVDLSAIRRVQRRLGALLYASELSADFQAHLRFVADQLTLQEKANEAVDHAIATHCEQVLHAREGESKRVLAEIGQRIERQSARLHDECERLAQFFLRVAAATERSDRGVEFVNLSAMDLLDALKDADDETNEETESAFRLSCARLRHAANSAVLEDEFQACLRLLSAIETLYRTYHKKTTLAATHHQIATETQRQHALYELCDLFGLLAPHTKAPFDFQAFLSITCINDLVEPPPSARASDAPDAAPPQPSGEPSAQQPEPASGTATAVAASAAAKPQLSSHKDGEKAPTKPEDVQPTPPTANGTLETATGLVLPVLMPVPALVEAILTRRRDNEDEEPAAPERSEQETVTTEAADASPSDASEQEQELEKEPRVDEVLAIVAREFQTIEIGVELQVTLIERFRRATLDRFSTTFAAHERAAADLLTQRRRQFDLLLEERLRLHWPRKGRLDVQCLQPRVSELYSHQQRQARHVRSMVKRVDAQDAAFQERAQAAAAKTDEVRVRQLSLQTQLPLQLSLAALQGLEAKSKKLLAAFRQDTDDAIARLRAMVAADLAALAAAAQEFVRVCSAQVFPDLLSTDVIAGCDYHPEEVESVRLAIAETEATLRERIEARNAAIAAIAESQRQVLDTAKEFKTRYQACLQSLSMKEGLGQKFGLPRRTAQERYRSETTRAVELSAHIDELLACLSAVVEKKESVDGPRLPKDADVSTQVLHLLTRLRALLLFRGRYFGFLKNVSQLAPTAIAYDAGGVQGRASFTDLELVETEYQSSPMPFLEFVKQVATKCREETRQLFQQEGKLDELPPSGVPPALEEYLHALDDKARSFAIQQELRFREQVEALGDHLAVAPGVAFSDLQRRITSQTTVTCLDLRDELDAAASRWSTQKNKNMLDLRPDLCSPNSSAQLQQLCDREAQRSQSTCTGLREMRANVLKLMANVSADFERELLAMFKTFVTLLDTSVMTLDDLTPFTGEELPKAKRKSLKRLRKLARLMEHGDPREAKRSEDELKKLQQLGETPRFPRRNWPGIPSFGLHQLWESQRSKLVAEDQAMNAPSDALLTEVPIAASTPDDGACVALLTHAHRCLMRERDAAYAAFVAACEKTSAALLADLQERLRDEIKWTESWQQAIARMQQQPEIYRHALASRRAMSSSGDATRPFVYVHPSAKIGARCRIEPFVSIGEDVEIGDDTAIASHVTLQNCRIGSRVVLHPGVRVGQDGFGFQLASSGEHSKKPQELLVEIHDDAEIGANCTIDRGSWRNTVIGRGCKLDNLVQIGHNVQLGAGCVIAAQSGIAGSTTLGKNVHMGGQVGIAQHLQIGDNVRIAAKSGVMSNLESNKTYGGTPAVPIMEYRRRMVFLREIGKKAGGEHEG
ncbi:hypothetical protein ATCC90586_007409 [Pythium insidiosum]|nr:hypothetical protein ATCC90586_007409 [Pythium insidiosum]